MQRNLVKKSNVARVKTLNFNYTLTLPSQMDVVLKKT